MMSKSDLQAVLDQMRTEERAARVEPPTVEEMLAYRRGGLSGTDEARVRELLTCWPELLRALMTPYPDGDPQALPAEKLEQQWSAMRSHIGAGGGGRVLSFRNALTAIAATLALVFGALFWQARMELRRPRAFRPQALESNAMRGGEHAATTLTGSDDYFLAPRSISDYKFEKYSFELMDGSNPPRRVW